MNKIGQLNSHALWVVKCECGNTFGVPATNLISGNTTKCKDCKATNQRKLTKEDVSNMILCQSRGVSIASLASDYGVSRSTVHRNTCKNKQKGKK